MKPLRLQKLIAEHGVASRRHAEEMIREGRVTVNGEVVTVMGFLVDPAADRVAVDGKLLEKAARRRSYVLYKPIGYICTRKDPEGRKTVYDLLPPEVADGLHSAGRLDMDAEGLLILTSDGDLTLHLSHPSRHLPKTYLVKVKGEPGNAVLKRLRTGVELDDGVTLPAEVAILKGTGADRNSWLRLVLTEGRKNQIKRMCDAVGHRVLRIKRVAIGRLVLPDHMKPGSFRKLTEREVEWLKSGRGDAPSPRLRRASTGTQGHGEKRRE